jgi:CxxC motif-containing protein (DUF1111 family)
LSFFFLGEPLPNLPSDARAAFREGRAEFQERETVGTGLGPVFNADSCAACHSIPAVGGWSQRTVTRFGRSEAGRFDELASLGGSLIQDSAIRVNGCGLAPERVPAAANVVARRRTTGLFGLGLVEAVPEATFVALAAAQKQHPDGIAGRVNRVFDPALGKTVMGRFGWKAQVGSLLAFAGNAYLNEMGITNPLFVRENCPSGDCSKLLACDTRPDPEDDGGDVLAFTDFMRFLAPPRPPRYVGWVAEGARTFDSIGCTGCHTPSLRTGPNSMRALDRVELQPFSDFLLHDMGRLGDGIAQDGAGPTEMRTAPLWGISFQTAFLHDGRAVTVEQAILAHDGQGRRARDRFAQLDFGSRAKLLYFLRSL